MSIASISGRSYRKLRRIAACDLTPASKLRYGLDLAAGSMLPFAARGAAAETGYREYRMRGGTSVVLRENSTDGKVFEEIFVEETYTPLTKAILRNAPILLIDLGANIGLSSIALARELNPVAIVAVEPDRGNFAMLRENIRLAGLADRCTTLQAFAGVEKGFAELVDSGNGSWGLRMGAPARKGIPVAPMEEILSVGETLAQQSASPFPKDARALTTVLKCDIEGAEAPLFRNMAQWEDRVHHVILELHTEFLSADEFRACLEASRYHWRIDGTIPSEGVLAVIGLERQGLKTAPESRRAASL
jgi:FkbM family methyltransferase